MFSAQNSRRLALLAAATLLLAGSPPQADRILVLRSAGPSATSYPPGKVVLASTPLRLRPGDTIVLLDRSGTRAYRGPAAFKAGAAPVQPQGMYPTGPRLGSLGAISSTRSQSRSYSYGSARPQMRTTLSPPTLWHVDVRAGGRYCAPAAGSVFLWRQQSTNAESLTIRPAQGPVRTVTWQAGQRDAEWPKELALGTGAYELAVSGGGPTKIQLIRLAPMGTDLQSIAAALIRHKCEKQIDWLIEGSANRHAEAGFGDRPNPRRYVGPIPRGPVMQRPQMSSVPADGPRSEAERKLKDGVTNLAADSPLGSR